MVSRFSVREKVFGKSYSLENSLQESIFREDIFLYNCPQIADNPTLANNSPMAAVLAISGLVVAVVLCALPLSGGIFNPMLGLVLFGGCEGHTWVSS